MPKDDEPLSITNYINLAACVCAEDGLISQAEEAKIFEIVHTKFPKFNKQEFENVLDMFFDSTMQIEEYAGKVTNRPEREFCLFLAKESASADGFGFRENIALQKVICLWNGIYS